MADKDYATHDSSAVAYLAQGRAYVAENGRTIEVQSAFLQDKREALERQRAFSGWKANGASVPT